MNGTCEKYLKKEKKKRENKERSQHALILKTLNNFINQLHLFLEYIEHKYIYKDFIFFCSNSIRNPNLTSEIRT